MLHSSDPYDCPLVGELRVVVPGHAELTDCKPNLRNNPSNPFAVEATAVCEAFVDAIQNHGAVQAILDGVNDAVYIKTTDGQIVHSNAAYEDLFAGRHSSIGRMSDSFLSETMIPVAKQSDALIVAGCPHIDFESRAVDAHGRSIVFRTFKKSLLGIGHPKHAIFGYTRILAVVDDKESHKLVSLAARWKIFQSLDARDQEIAAKLGHGVKIKALAQELSVSDKTVENRRNAILETLSLGSQLDLLKLLVRMQDNGFHDFGL